jgi:CBS-domain-containing membrane protein
MLAIEVGDISSTDVSSSNTSCASSILSFIPKKWQGELGKTPPAMTKPTQIVVSSLLAFVGIQLVALTDYYYLTESFRTDNAQSQPVRMLSGAYAATAVLVYEAYQSPLAQPRNVIGGYLVTSLTGVSVRLLCQRVGVPDFVAGALSLAVGLAAMNLTKTLHPPGGACALIAVIGGKSVHALGYGYVLTSVGASLIMVAVAVLGNNLVASRQYPLYWW